MEQFFDIFLAQLAQYGTTCLGLFLTALAFCLFSNKDTLYLRFQLIGRGFFVLFFANLLLLILPCFSALNPSMRASETVLQVITNLLYACACGHFIASLFVGLPKILVSFVFPGACVCLFAALQYFFTKYDLTTLSIQQLASFLVGLTLALAAFGFHDIPSISQKTLFRTPKIGLWILGACFMLDAFSLLPKSQTVFFILYILIATLVLAAQLRFISYLAQKYQTAFENEQHNKTFLWDMAPFPILLTKLIDDSVVYMNQPCQKVLGITDEQKQQLRFSSYFTTPQKRDELIEKTKQAEFLDNFEVELNIQNATPNTVWITLSARVFEMDGELFLYINFTNITEHKQTEQTLATQAATDALTGLYNRRQFITSANQALALHQREQKPFSFLMLDIDHFKNINDTYGHDVGDSVLKKLAETLQTNLRKSDIIARWGGEEFVVFLHNTNSQQALQTAEQIKQAVQDLTVDIDNKQINFTISIGVSLTQIFDIDALQKEADIALYHSKENGRNQVTLYQADLTMPEAPEEQS